MSLRQLSSRTLCALAFLCVSVELPAGPVNINTADAATLAHELKGIGLKRAQAIVDYRSKNGPFRSADELALVKGIGTQAIARNRNEIRVDGGRPAAKPAPQAATTSSAAKGAGQAPASRPPTRSAP